MYGGGSRVLANKNVISESRTCKELMNEKFIRLCGVVLGYRSSRNFLIQQVLLSVLPRLAAFQPKTFVTKLVFSIVISKKNLYAQFRRNLRMVIRVHVIIFIIILQ